MAAAMLASIPSKDELYDYAARAYDPDTRVPLVEAVLNKVGADKYLNEKQALTTYELAPNTRRSTVPVEALATCTTAAGLVKEAPALLERAAPRLYEKGSGLFEKSKEKYEELVPVVAEYKEAVAARVTLAREGADGRAAVLAEGKELATERIVVPARAAAAPYIAKIADRKAALVEKKEALLADKRLARALDALHEAHAHRAWPTRTGPGPRAPGLAHGRPVDSDTTRVITEACGARAHPVATAEALRETACDLLQYEKLVAYREYVLSDAFARDTRRLVQEDLPSLARGAAQHSLDRLHAATAALSEELTDGKVSGAARAAVQRPAELLADVHSLDRLVALSGRARVLLSELTLQAARLDSLPVPRGARARLEWPAAGRCAVERSRLAALIAPAEPTGAPAAEPVTAEPAPSASPSASASASEAAADEVYEEAVEEEEPPKVAPPSRRARRL
ncbi:hypothetical protein EMIHUDRAFT_465517 [Emiliania huxleyi CCMP1516]|uniref:Uncharacterized protein n=2 Tax=Emiliania huxleyi TaxID=2903 RepID=A0A0D3IBC3_EMIH1|nr:hypothetical protein EMIHUDRAFT_465517 [Emiliania huxleyi CCMP1516]EOD08558.1 hypothetical protein EMIHUDRAFT_465517 [Emiliania huxleyi CCMP1516]|eukprot:XP_005760987.1 hypothetical protein EMIHUDRAFT_465517 [Emiliania huxleyi CCMP1516]